ncbi:OST-HTH/LOTUS domain-containing protein [Fibrobacterota bacterium]
MTKELITRAIKQISARNSERWVVKAKVRPVVKRLGPTFDEANYDCRTFSELLKKHPNKFKVKKGEHDHIISLVE